MKGRVAVLGGGVIGWCSAIFASNAGFEVTVVEREPADFAGASSSNSGLIVPSHIVPLAAPGMVRLGLRLMLNKRGPFGFKFGADPYLWAWAWRFMRSCSQEHVERCAPVLAEMHLRSKQLYLEFTKRLEGLSVEEQGLLTVCREHSTLEHEMRLLGLAEKHGVRAEPVGSGRALAELEPGLSASLAGAVWYKDDTLLDPGRFLALLRDHGMANGVRFVHTDAVASFAVENASIKTLRTSTGLDVEADEFVLATGAWSREAGAKLGLHLPIIGGKGHSLNISDSPALPRIPLILVEARAAITSLGSTLRIGGTMELGAPKAEINLARVEGIRESVRHYLVGLDAEHLSRAPIWAGLRPVSPDGMPMIGRPKRVKNLIVATGHAMMGQSLGPITGQLVGELLRGEPSTISLATMNPDRFN